MRREKRKERRKSRMADRMQDRAVSGVNKGSGYLSIPSGVSKFKVKKGNFIFSVIPYTTTKVNKVDNVPVGELNHVRTIYTHTKVGPEDVTLLCPGTFKKPCPICDARKLLEGQEDASEDAIKALVRKQRELYNLWDADEEKMMILDYSYHGIGKFIEREIRESDDDDLKYYMELEDGYELKVRLSESDFSDKFFVVSKLDFIPREDIPTSISKKAVDLDSILNCKSYDNIKNIFLGLGELEEDDSPTVKDECGENMVKEVEEEVVEKPKPSKKVIEEVIEEEDEETNPVEKVVEQEEEVEKTETKEEDTSSEEPAFKFKRGEKITWEDADEDTDEIEIVKGTVATVNYPPEEDDDASVTYYEVIDSKDEHWVLPENEIKKDIVKGTRRRRG